MFGPMLLLLLILAGAYAWQNALRARERARELGSDLCMQANVQLLDQTVALQRMRLIRGPRGLRLRRDYRFDFSIDGQAIDALDNVVRFPVRPSLEKH